MKKSIVEMILEFIRQVRRNKRWQRAVTCVAALVVFVTTYALILPAITMEGNHPRLASEKLAGWAGDPMSVSVSAESPAGSGEKVVVLTAESVSAGLSEKYEFDAEGITAIEDKMGQEIRLHRTVREDAEDTVDYWFVLAAGQKTEFDLDLQDEIVVDDVIASAGIVENVRINKTEEAEKASASDAVKVEETEVAAVVDEATASNAVKASVVKATASNTAKASASNADVEDEEDVDTDEDTGEILDGAVINDLDVSDIDQETEVTATLKLNAGMGDELAEAIRDAEKNAEKRGNASLEFSWKMTVNTTQELEWSENGVTVHMYYNAAAKIPEGAHLSVAEIEEGSEEYRAYLKSAEKAVKADKATGSNAAKEKDAVGVSYARFFDITILDAEENEIQPASQVVVKISYDEAAEISEEAEVKTVHFPSEGGTEVIDAVVEGGSTNLDGVAFNATGFSVYGIVGTQTIETTVLTVDGSTYKVSVDLSKTTNIPKGATLSAKEIAEGTAEYTEYFNKTAKEINQSMTLSFARFFDVEILANGEKIEPDAPVQISIEYLGGTDITGSAAIGIIHFAEDGIELIDKVKTDIDGSQMKSIEYTQDSLSVIGTIGTSGYTSLDSVADKMFVVYAQKNNTPYALTHTYGDYYEGDDIKTSSPSVLVGEAIDSLVVWHAEKADNGYRIYYEDLDDSTRKHYLVVDNNGTFGDSKEESTIWSSESGYLRFRNSENTGYVAYNGGSLKTTDSISSAVQIFFATVDVNDPYLNDGLGPVLRAANLRATSDAPAHSKRLIPNNVSDEHPNGDGTYTLALSVTGATSSSSTTQVTKANVILVLDTSNSMNSNYTYYNGQRMTRLNAEKRVLTENGGIIDSLLEQNVAGDAVKSDIIEVAIANFGTRGSTAQTFTTSASSLKSTVNGLTNSQGTNWEEGLMRAQELAASIKTSQPNEEVYVIFLTDGEPTTHNNSYNVNTNYATEWGYANDNARAIVTAGYHFYGIFTWGSGNRSHYLSSLVNYAYTGSGNSSSSLEPAYEDYFTDATSTETLIEKLKQITHDITTAVGYTNVELEDGVTTMTASSVKTTAGGKVTGLKYYRSGGTDADGNEKYDSTANNGLGVEWTEAPAATINSDGEVDWNLGNLVLENGVTYTVTFVVWPSQKSVDLVADLNNGKVNYDELTPDQKSQIAVSGGKYTLKTNTDYPTVTYSTVTTTTVDGVPTTVVSEPTTTNITNPDPVDLTEARMTVEKKWDDNLDPTQRENVGDSVTLHLNMGNARYIENIVLSKTNDWKLENFVSIAPGIMVTSDSPAYDPDATHVTYAGETYAVLETGHDYIFEEEDIDLHYQLTAYTHHPMLVNGVLRYVTFAYDSSGNITGIEDIYDDATLSATNTLRGGINITKTVKDQTDAVVDYDGLFEATVTLTAPTDAIYNNLEDYTQGDSVVKKSVAWYAYYNGNQRLYDSDLIELGILEPDGTDSSGYPAGKGTNHDKAYGSGWFMLDFDDATHVAAGTVALSPKYTVRFVNMAAGVTYDLEETGTNEMTPSISWSHKDAEGNDVKDKDGRTITEKVVIANSANNIDVTNTTQSAEVELLKIGDGNEQTKLDGVKFKLYSDADCTKQVTKDAFGNVIGATETIDGVEHQAVLTTDENGKLSFGSMVKGTYYLQEIVTKAGYNLLTENIVITVETDGTVTASGPLMTKVEYSEQNNIYTITVSNSSGTELPHTGGHGTLPFRIAGLALMLMGAAYVSYDFKTRRRRERRLKK